MSRNATVSVAITNIFPKNEAKKIYINDYHRKTKIPFIVTGLKKKTKVQKNKTNYVLTLKFKKDDDKQHLLPDQHGIEWFSNVSMCKLMVAGPPAQLFFPPQPRVNTRKRGPSRNSSIRTQPVSMRMLDPSANNDGDRSDLDESDADDFQYVEEQEAPAVATPAAAARGVDARYNVQWEDEFQSEIAFNGRGIREKTKPKMAGIEDASALSPCDFYKKFLPMKYIAADLLPATNRELEKNGIKSVTNKAEFLGWLGIWINISLYPGFAPRDFFSLTKREFDFHPPYLGVYVTGKHFEQINSHLTLTMQELPKTYRDRFWWVRPLIDAFNKETQEDFIAGWLIVLDKSMVVFLNKYAPGWTVVKRKPHPMGNEYHTTACCNTKIIFHIEIVEGKDQPKEGPHATGKFEEEFGSKMGALVVRMMEGVRGSGRCVILDSGFGYVPSVVQLKNKGLFSKAYIKKHVYWPKYTKAQEAVNEMSNQEVGEVRVRRGT